MASVQDIYDEITRIDNAKQGIAEAIEEKGVQVPEESRIGEYPGLVRQIQTGSPDAVLYTPQELTSEQKEQARENIGAGTYTKPGTGIPKTDLAAGVKTSLENADTALQPEALTPITELIPEQATPENKLADKNFVNSSVATNTANYISDNGQPFQSVADLEAYTGTLTNNDYAFVVGTDSAGNTTYTRYKYNANTQTWAAEYVLNNSSFTAAQWAAISSGITALLVQKLSDLPTEVVTYVGQTLTEAQKQQARTNIGATAPEIFWAQYGETTASEIEQALTDNKLVVCFYNNALYSFSKQDSGYYYLSYVNGNSGVFIRVSRTTNIWSTHSYVVELTGNRVTEINRDSDNTHYPTAKAVWDAMQNGKEVFIATYGTTTFADISAANSAGKVCIAIKSGDTKVYVLGDMQAASARFYITQGQYNYELRYTDQNVWSTGSTAFLRNSDKVDTIEGNETATNKIPSTKAVADFAVQSLTASGKKIWAGTQAEFDLLTPSNDTIYFIIPAL